MLSDVDFHSNLTFFLFFVHRVIRHHIYSGTKCPENGQIEIEINIGYNNETDHTGVGIDMFYFIINMHEPCMSDLAGSTTYSHFASSLPVDFYA